MFFKLILSGAALWLANNLYHLYTNYLLARQISLPIIICPTTWQNPLWVLLCSAFPVRNWSNIPGLRWIRFSYLGWVLHDTYHARAELGPAFTIVSPAKNEVILADPAAIAETMSKHKRWLRPREMYTIFTILGENVDSSNGDEGLRHRKIINAGFAEPTNKIVWEAATKQARQWMKEQTITYKQLNEATDTISMNVLMRAGFGKDYDFNEAGLKDVKIGHKKSFAEALRYMVQNLFFGWIFQDARLPSWVEPAKFRELREIKGELKSYFSDIIDARSGAFVKALVEANEDEKAGGRGHLSQDELYGNMYLIQLAGHDTSSYAISFTLALLSCHPDIQEWVRQGAIQGGYEESFPNAVRCRAALLETLRRHTAAPNLERVSPNAETLRIAGKDYVIPPNTMVASHFPSIHTDSEIWGEDHMDWKPQRWIEEVDGKETLKKRFEMMAWSTGPRGCPGQKFSQVEVTAALCTILKDYRLEGSANMEDVLNDFEFVMTPKPNKPESATINFVKI